MKFKLTGEIIPNEYTWLYTLFGIEHCCPAMLDAAIDMAEPGDRKLEIEINSPGGSVFSGFEMYGRIKALQHDGWSVSAYVTALAASAATTVMSACDPVLLTPVSQIMIHEPSCNSEGNKEDHAETIRMLKSIEESILAGYCDKCGKKTDKAELRALMEKSSWIPAADAIALGLADGYIDDEEFIIAGINIAALAQTVSNSAFDGSGSSPEKLLKLYEQNVRAGLIAPDSLHPVGDAPEAAEPEVSDIAAPEPEIVPESEPEPVSNLDTPADSWTDKACIELERERYRYELP